MGMTLMATAQLTMDVNTKKLGAPVQSTMYGIFFEDINYAADGGLYGELVKNRSFEFPLAVVRLCRGKGRRSVPALSALCGAE